LYPTYDSGKPEAGHNKTHLSNNCKLILQDVKNICLWRLFTDYKELFVFTCDKTTIKQYCKNKENATPATKEDDGLFFKWWEQRQNSTCLPAKVGSWSCIRLVN
jgi:hypothetical protein